MRTWLISRTLPTSVDPVAGIFVADMAEALRSAHVDSSTLRIAARSWQSRRVEPSLVPSTDVAVLTPPRGIGRDHAVAAAIAARGARHGRPDVLHAHWSTNLRGVALAGRMLRVPVVFTEHGGPFPAEPATSGRVVAATRTLNAADKVLAVSAWLRDLLIDRGVTTPISVVPNIVDTSVFHPTASARDSGDPHALVVARLDGFDKGIPEAIAAVAELRRTGIPITLSIVGDGPDRARLETVARPIGRAVEFTGTLTRPQIAQRLRDATMLISATRRFETFGVAVAEALASGRPVVATSVGAIPELVDHGVNGVLVEPAGAQPLIDGIAEVLERRWDPAAIAATVAHCAPARVAADLVAIYRDL